jgi:hypothetical protein
MGSLMGACWSLLPPSIPRPLPWPSFSTAAVPNRSSSVWRHPARGARAALRFLYTTKKATRPPTATSTATTTMAAMAPVLRPPFGAAEELAALAAAFAADGKLDEAVDGGRTTDELGGALGVVLGGGAGATARAKEEAGWLVVAGRTAAAQNTERRQSRLGTRPLSWQGCFTAASGKKGYKQVR